MANDVPETVTDALALLERDGYVADFNIQRGAIACPACSHEHPLDQSIIERVFRFEGPSDPADEAIVLGLRCPMCGIRGTYVSSFGPNADPEAMAGLSYLAGRPSAPTASRPIPPSAA